MVAEETKRNAMKRVRKEWRDVSINQHRGRTESGSNEGQEGDVQPTYYTTLVSSGDIVVRAITYS